MRSHGVNVLERIKMLEYLMGKSQAIMGRLYIKVPKPVEAITFLTYIQMHIRGRIHSMRQKFKQND